MSSSPPKSLLDLPLELRQTIPVYAFEDATTTDITLNLLIRIRFRTKVSWVEPELGQLIERPDGGADDVDNVGLPIEDEHNQYNPPLFAPNIESLAMALRDTHEQLAHDLLYVLKRALGKFEEEYDVHSREQWKIWWEENINENGDRYPSWLSWYEFYDPWYDWTTDPWYDDK
ncbi:hypothetical protein BLS_009787 [Venturia inaequalis]|nr:hypothetical protein EG328_010276 [Venturia inaequalis]KAE9979480.1 hypothetical protein BLS_009787 [Venturia inaequalis]